MVDNIKNYMYYANQEREGFIKLYNSGSTYDFMAGMAQSICEKYLKQIIDDYCQPSTVQEQHEKEMVLHTHNLRNLFNLLEKYEIDIDQETKKTILYVDGYYFSTRYPGPDSSTVSKNDLKECLNSINVCKETIESIKEDMEYQDQSFDIRMQ